jgi:hypothetical protein
MEKKLKLKSWLTNFKQDIFYYLSKLKPTHKPREGNSSAKLDEIFDGDQIDLVSAIIENSGFDFIGRKTGYVNLYRDRVHAQLHPCNGGVDIVVRDADEECPKCTILKSTDRSDLNGYKGANKGWLDGDGTRGTYSPAVAFTIPNDLIKGWQEIWAILDYAHDR